ncbi:MAG: hypothetical protein DHS20C15_07880 [Planctomycetota bacterium]|nr:MAG: hypothetical protein DHS20C15_07880 [Planctomycetota bacterium]
MTTSRALPVLFLFLSLAACAAPTREAEWDRPLPPGQSALRRLPDNWPRPDISHQWADRARILPALENSIQWMGKPSSPTHFPMADITHARAAASLERFRELLQTSANSAAFASAIEKEFDVYQSVGWDGRGGGTLFTAYCTPILEGSLTRDATHRFPLYGLPADLAKGEGGKILGRRGADGRITPYPTRARIEDNKLLEGQGLELCWLADPLDAFIAHVNGSAVVRLPDGKLLRLGYAGKNGAEYASLRAELERRGELRDDDRGLEGLRRWAARTPEREVISALHVNPTYVFFTPIDGTPRGSLNVPVTARRTIATDKSLFPRGALVYVDAGGVGRGGRSFRQLMLDQDTGGAIRTAGRADLYLGTGDYAEKQAGETVLQGQMYYLFLKEPARRGHARG